MSDTTDDVVLEESADDVTDVKETTEDNLFSQIEDLESVTVEETEYTDI